MEQHPADAASSAPPPPDRPLALHEATMLVRDLVQATTALDRALGGHLGVNATDLRAMSHLLQAGPRTQGELAAELGLGASATSMVVDRLERAGHATRERATQDRRRVLVRPTPGTTEVARSALAPMIVETDRLLDGLDEAERAVVATYLRGVVAAVQRRADAVGAGLTAP